MPQYELSDGTSTYTLDSEYDLTDDELTEAAKQLFKETTPAEQTKNIIQNATQTPVEQPTLTGEVQQNVRQELDKKGKVHFVDADTGEEIKSNLSPLQKVGRKLKATGENIRSFMTQDYGEPLKARQKAGAMILSSLLPAGQGLLPMIGAGALGGGLYSAGEQYIDKGKIDPLQTTIDTVLGGATGGAFNLGGKAIGAIANKVNKVKKLKRGSTKVQPEIETPEVINLGGPVASEEEVAKMTAKKANPIQDVTAEKTNYFGAEIPETPTTTSPKVETKRSRLQDTADLPPEMQGRNVEYEVLHNEDLINQASNNIAQDADSVRVNLINKAQDKKATLEALDFEEGRQLLDKLYSEGKFDDADLLLDHLVEKASKAGQAVQALSLWRAQTPAGLMNRVNKMITEYNSKHKNKITLSDEQKNALLKQVNYLKTLDQRLANKKLQYQEALAKAQTVEEANAVKQQIADFDKMSDYIKDVRTAQLNTDVASLIPKSGWDKFKTIRNIMLLGNIKTAARNITGNVGFAALERGVTGNVAAAIDAGIGKFTGKRTRVATQVGDYIGNLLNGAKKAAYEVNLGINTRDLGSKYDLSNSPTFKGGLFGSLEKAVNYSLRVLDGAFYEATLQESLTNQVLAALKTKGVKVKKLTPEMMNANLTPEMVETATQEALEAVYQNASDVSQFFSKIRKDLGKGGDILLPYVQTPANILQQGINYSILGPVAKSIGGISDALGKGGLRYLPQTLGENFTNYMVNNQRQASMDLARALVGTGLTYGGYKLADKGIITPFIENYQERKNKELQGIGPNEIVLPNGSTMTINQLQPIAQPLVTGAALQNLGKGNYLGAADVLMKNVADLSMLQGLNNFVSTAAKPEEEGGGIPNALVNLAGDTVSQVTPTLGTQINATFTDPYQRETYDPNPVIQAGKRALNKIPVASRILPEKRNVAGEKIERVRSKGNNAVSKGLSKAWNAFVNPVNMNYPSDKDPVFTTVNNLSAKNEDKSVLFEVAKKRITMPDGTKKQLSGKEYSEYQKRLGKLTYQYYQEAINMPLFNNLSDKQKISILKDAKTRAKDQVHEELFNIPSKFDAKTKAERKIERKLNAPMNKVTKGAKSILNARYNNISRNPDRYND